jgi:hypothetical protein
MMNSIIKDLRFALRGLLKHPAFTAIAIITLALGIGGSTSIFTVVDAALLRGLPYKSPDRLYHLWEKTPQQAYPKREFSYPDYQDYQQNNVFDGLAGYTGAGAILSGLGDPENLNAPRVTSNFFSERRGCSGWSKSNGPDLRFVATKIWRRRERHRSRDHTQRK